MSTFSITTPSGHTVEFKDRLTFGERRQINRIMVGSMKFNIKEGKAASDPISAEIIMEMQEAVFKLAILSVTESGKEKVSGDGQKLLSIINGWTEEDGQFVFDEVDKKFNPEEKKKAKI